MPYCTQQTRVLTRGLTLREIRPSPLNMQRFAHKSESDDSDLSCVQYARVNFCRDAAGTPINRPKWLIKLGLTNFDLD